MQANTTSGCIMGRCSWIEEITILSADSLPIVKLSACLRFGKPSTKVSAAHGSPILSLQIKIFCLFANLIRRTMAKFAGIPTIACLLSNLATLMPSSVPART